MDPRQFYDDLAATYHALYPDWESESTAQAVALLHLLGAPEPGAVIADPACGIGTQLLGMAAAGHRLLGSDISPVAVERARRECAERGLPARIVVADMRALPWAAGAVDALVCADNAIPHLLTDEDVSRAFAEFHRVLRPGGRAVVTIRDYDALLAVRPPGTPPQVMDAAGRGRTISFQLWHWRADTDVYDLEHFQVQQDVAGDFHTRVRTTAYRAYTRRRLGAIARAEGFVDVHWHLPQRSSYFQPALTVTRP